MKILLAVFPLRECAEKSCLSIRLPRSMPTAVANKTLLPDIINTFHLLANGSALFSSLVTPTGPTSITTLSIDSMTFYFLFIYFFCSYPSIIHFFSLSLSFLFFSFFLFFSVFICIWPWTCSSSSQILVFYFCFAFFFCL